MKSFSRNCHSILAFAILSLSTISIVNADIIISRSISSQLPLIAYTGTEYTFTLATNTFAFSVPEDESAPPSPPTIAYSATNLPSWLTFDSSTLTFSGTAPPQEAGRTVRIPVQGSISTSSSSNGSTTASDIFYLPILNDAQPAVNIPIAKQLGSASSLGPSYMVAPDAVHLPFGWSFSIGLSGETFTIATGQNVYWSANLLDGSPLPNWLHFSNSTYDFYGVAPNTIGKHGGEYDVVVTGSAIPGYGGVSQTFKLITSTNALMLSGNGLSQINASVGTYFQYQIPLSGLQQQGQNLTNPNDLTVNVSLPSSLSWLNFQTENRTFSGIPPYDPYGNASSTTTVNVPITFSVSNASNSLTVMQPIAIQPSLFTALVLPNLFIKQGQSVSLSLGQYIRSSKGNNKSTRRRGLSKRRTIPSLAAAAVSSTSPNISVTYSPESTSQWLQYDPNALTLSGQVPDEWDQNSQITLNSPDTSTSGSSKASFYLAFNGQTPFGNPSNNTNQNGANGDGNHHRDQNGGSGLSRTAKIAIGASVGGVAGLIALILLFTCCRRKYDHDDFDRSGQHEHMRQRDDDEGTLTDQNAITKDRKWKKAIVIGRAGVVEVHTPSTAVPSPMPGFEEKQQKDVTPTQPDLHSVVVVSPNGRRRNAMDEADAPMQSRLIANLFGRGGNDQKRNSRMAQSPPKNNGTGLGLSMGEGESGDVDPFANPSRRIGHQRSRESVKSHRSSWESDLFYEDAPSSQQHQSSAEGHHHDNFDEQQNGDEIPRRRGNANVRSTTQGLNVRHRNTHINESPAFHTQDVFVPDSIAASNSSRSNLDGIGMAAMDSNFSVGDEFQDSQTGFTPGRLGESDARILKARVMQVQRHSPILHQGTNNPFTSHSVARPVDSARPYSIDNGHAAFEDAEDDDEWPGSMEGHGQRNAAIRKYGKQNNKQDKRTSVMSAMTDSSQLAGVRAHFANEAKIEAEEMADGASISAFDPKETVKPVGARPQTPTGGRPNIIQTTRQATGPVTPKTPKRAPGSSGSASGRFLPCPTIDAVIGHLLRFKMYPNVPPPLAGAPGSPGKRSGRTVRYELVMLDDRPHLKKYKNLWPAMLSDWLSIDNTTFEVEGVVPKATELEQLGDCEIALISTTRISGNPNSPDRQPVNNKRNSVSSYESGGRASISNDEERTVVARAKLVFQNAAPRIFIPKHGQAF